MKTLQNISRTLILSACVFFICALAFSSTGCAPAETEKTQFSESDAELIRGQIDENYGE